jgi:hypothetical protein
MTIFRDLLVAQGQPYGRVLAAWVGHDLAFRDQLLLHRSCIKVVITSWLFCCAVRGCPTSPNSDTITHLFHKAANIFSLRKVNPILNLAMEKAIDRNATFHVSRL